MFIKKENKSLEYLSWNLLSTVSESVHIRIGNIYFSVQIKTVLSTTTVIG